MNAGATIIVRVGENHAAIDSFLASLVQHNTYKPIEVFLWATESRQALATCRPYLAKVFVRVLPASARRLDRIGIQARFDNILIVDLPTQIRGDALAGWIRHQKTDLDTVLLCSKQQIAALADTALNTSLGKLIGKLGHPISHTPARPASPSINQAVTTQSPPKMQPPKKPQAKSASIFSQAQPQPKLAKKIQETIQQIEQIEAQLAKKEQDIVDTENQYLPVTDNTPEKQKIKEQLEDMVLASCRLLVELKDAQDNLQELRIRSICGA